jgi:hypothetical protein
MQVEIYSPSHPANGYEVYIKGTTKRLRTYTTSMFPSNWDEDEICKLLGETDYKRFEEGHYLFNLPNWKIGILEGTQPAKTREQLLFISQFF